MRKLKITYNNPRGLIFNDRQLSRRYAVNRKGILLNNTIKYDHPPDYYLGLNEAEYFQLSVVMDDLDEIIFMSDCIINGVQIMQIEILNNNPHNFRAKINGGLDLMWASSFLSYCFFYMVRCEVESSKRTRFCIVLMYGTIFVIVTFYYRPHIYIVNHDISDVTAF